MKKLILAALVVLGGTAFVSNMQRPNLPLTAGVLIKPAFYTSAATTGDWLDIANWNGAAAIVMVAKVQDADTTYCVLQDSVPGSAVAAWDSAIVGLGTDSTAAVHVYKRNGRYVRAVLRATGNAADSNDVAVTFVGLKRSR